MSTITLCDLPCTSDLDQRAMLSVRGGHSWGADVNLNLNVNQSLVQIQDVNLNVLNNNGSIGSDFKAPSVNLAATQTGFNSAVIPKMF